MNADLDSTVKETSTNQILQIDFLYLDENVCAPCGGTADALSKAIDQVTAPLRELGIVPELTKIHVLDKKTAKAEKFTTSPTIRINVKDIDPARTEDSCPTCGSLAGDKFSMNCRTWHWQGDVYLSAPVGKIVEEIMTVAVQMSANDGNCCVETCCGEDGTSDKETAQDFDLPKNLIIFFDARDAAL